MCSALASRTAPSSRSARGQPGSSLADVRESPDANNVTSWPSPTNSSVSQETTRSVPPYNFGGMASVSGAICAIRILDLVFTLQFVVMILEYRRFVLGTAGNYAN